MTNKEIIATYKQMNNVTEELHTFAAWKSMGYSVKPGEKAQHKFMIWKHVGIKGKTADGEEIDSSKMFLQNTAFFLKSQVEQK